MKSDLTESRKDTQRMRMFARDLPRLVRVCTGETAPTDVANVLLNAADDLDAARRSVAELSRDLGKAQATILIKQAKIDHFKGQRDTMNLDMTSAVQWWKNGDHPGDYAHDVTGFEGGELRTFTGAERWTCSASMT